MNESYESLTIPSFDINGYLILMNDVLNNPSILSKQNELPTLSSRIGFIKLFNNWLQTQTIESNLMNQNDIRIHNTFGEISLRFNRTIEFTRATVSIESTQGHLNILCETEDDSMQFSFSSVDPNGAIKELLSLQMSKHGDEAHYIKTEIVQGEGRLRNAVYSDGLMQQFIECISVAA